MILRAGGGLFLVAMLVLGLLTTLWGRGEHYRRAALRNALARDSVEAALDTTRTTLSGDIATRERRILQLVRERDSLDRRLKRTTAFRSQLTLTSPAMDTTLRAPVVEDSETRIIRFPPSYSPPFTVAAVVTVPPPPDSADLNLGIRLDPASLEVRIQCGERRAGVRPATLFVRGPAWLGVVVDSVWQTPEVCQPEIKAPSRHGMGYYAVRAGAGFGALALLLSAVR